MSGYEDQMASIRARFVDRLREDNAALQALAQGDDPDRDARIGEIAHRIAGMSGLLGFPELTVLGKEADRAARDGVDRASIEPFIAAVARTVAAF